MKRLPAQTLQLILADHRRWSILRILAREGPMPAGAIAVRIGTGTVWTSRNLGILRDAGLVSAKYKRVFQITPEFQPGPGAEFLDLGDFLLRLDEGGAVREARPTVEMEKGGPESALPR